MDKEVKTVTIRDVTYIPELTAILLTVTCIRKKSLEVVFKTDACSPEVGVVLVL